MEATVIKAGATLITPLVVSSLSESLKEEHLGDDQEPEGESCPAALNMKIIRKLPG